MSASDPPPRRASNHVPAVLSLAMKRSVPPTDTRLTVPNVPVPANSPVTYTLSLVSVISACAASPAPVPPAERAQSQLPSGSILAMKMSAVFPAEFRVVVPNVAAPVYWPAM